MSDALSGSKASPQAPAGLGPSGYDPGETLWLLWASQGEYSDRSEWPIALYPDELSAQFAVKRGEALWRELFDGKGYVDWDEEEAIKNSPLGVELTALAGDCDANDMIYLTCRAIKIRPAIVDTHPKGQDPEEGLGSMSGDGARQRNRHNSIAQPKGIGGRG